MNGIHHITAITGDVQRNIDFWVGFLGMRLVKQTAGFEDVDQLHLFYGDDSATPGSLVSFLVWQDGGSGRVGHGQVAEIALAVPVSRIGDWLERCLTFQVRVEGPVREFNQPVLRLRDPDGIIVKLVGLDIGSGVWPSSPSRICGATLWSENPEATIQFLANLDFTATRSSGGVTRLESNGDFLDIRDTGGFVEGVQGGGTIDHVALAVQDTAALKAYHHVLSEIHLGNITIHDRKYFTSLYVRESAGVLLELATEGPGMSVDEPIEDLGTTLKIPSHFDRDVDEVRLRLPQFLLPGQEGVTRRRLSFVHRLYVPEDHDGSTFVLFHGSGGHETDLFPFASKVSPGSMLLGVRGRALEEGVPRYFRRSSHTGFDIEDVRSEAEAFEHFLSEAVAAYDLDRTRLTFAGYSNGANFLGAVLMKYPEHIRRSILLRGVAVLDENPTVSLDECEVLLIDSSTDSIAETFSNGGRSLSTRLRELGASVTQAEVEGGHDLGDADVDAARDWLHSLTENE